MNRSLSRRLGRLESAASKESASFSRESLLSRADELQAEGREKDMRPTEFGGLFSPNQVIRMAALERMK